MKTESLKKENQPDTKLVSTAVFRHKFTGYVGHFVKEYKPTGKPLTMQIKISDGRIYFAPKHEFELLPNGTKFLV